MAPAAFSNALRHNSRHSRWHKMSVAAEAMNIKGCRPEFDLGREALAYLPAAGLVVLDD